MPRARPSARRKRTGTELVPLYGELAHTASVADLELNRPSRSAGPPARRPHCAWSTNWSRRGTLDRYHLLPSVRGDLLQQLGRHAEAALEFERAASLATNAQERHLSEERARISRTW